MDVALLLSTVKAILGFVSFCIKLVIVYKELCWDFDGYCIESVAWFQKVSHFYYVNTTDP